MPVDSSSRFSTIQKNARAYVDVSQFLGSVIYQYPADNRSNGAPTCEIGPVSRALGMAAGVDGTLYVVADGQKGPRAGVFVFPETPTNASANRCGPPTLFFEDTYGEPIDPAVDGTILYLSNTSDGISLPPSIAVFNTKRTYPTGNLTDPTAGSGYAVTVDKHHNLFWSNLNKWTGGGQVIEFAKGKMPGTVLRSTMIGKDYPGSVLVDHDNNLLLLDATKSALLIFAAPYNKRAFFKIVLRGAQSFCALGRHDERLYCLDYQMGDVDVYTYPRGKFLYSFDNGMDVGEDPLGIAVRPQKS